MRKILLLILFISTLSCESDIKSSIEYKELEKKIENQNSELITLRNTIDSLNNTADKQYFRASKMLSQNKRKEALNYFSKIVDNYKGSEYAKKSEKEIEKIEGYFKEEKRKDDLKKIPGI